MTPSFKIYKLLIIMGLLGFLKFFTGCSGFLMNYGYNIKDGKVYYKPSFPNAVFEVEGADARSFEETQAPADTTISDYYYYAKDKNSVFYMGYKIPNSDGPSWKMIGLRFSKDKGQCYYEGKIIEGADPVTFKIIEDKYSSDKKYIFKREYYVDDDPSVFESYNGGILIRTLHTVVIYDDIVEMPEGAKFKYLAGNYFAVDNQIYYRQNPLPDADIPSFKMLDSYYAKTKDHVYYDNKIIEGADPLTYEIMELPYGKDKKHIFFFDRIVEGVDLPTFEIINIKFQCCRDKNACFHEDKRITNFTKEDLVNKNTCTNCNETGIYFADSIGMSK